MLSWDTWLAVLSIALPLIAKAATDWNANVSANHNKALDRIVGMAGRSAAEIALALSALPAGSTLTQAKSALIANARERINTEMAASLKTVGATSAAVETILAGEVAKLEVPAAAIVPPAPTLADRVAPVPLVPRSA